jgi:hypothetical protein
MTVRNSGTATLALWRPATEACHLRRKATLIDKDQVFGVKIVLAIDPVFARGPAATMRKRLIERGASGVPNLTAGSFASNGYNASSPQTSQLAVRLVAEIILNAAFPIVILGSPSKPRYH